MAEALYKQGLGLIYYSNDNSTLEEDFFVRSTDALIPVEVKSNRQSSKSLRNLIVGKKYKDISFGVKFGDLNVGNENNIYTFPYFCVFLLKRFVTGIFISI